MPVQLDGPPPSPLTITPVPPKAHRSPRWLLPALAGLNLLLAAGLFVRLHDNSALGAVLGQGNYLLVAGRSQNTLTLYALETGTGKLLAIKQDASQNRSTVIATADVADDLDRAFPKK